MDETKAGLLADLRAKRDRYCAINGKYDLAYVLTALDAFLDAPAPSQPTPEARTAKMRLFNLKEPDGWTELLFWLGLGEDEALRRKHFEYGEYANIEIEVDRDLRIVGGRILTLEESK
jgi:hypothetical protein